MACHGQNTTQICLHIHQFPICCLLKEALHWDRDTYLHRSQRKPGEFWGVLWNSILLIFCYLTIRRAVSLHRSLIEASRYCKSTTAWSLPLVLWDEEGLRCIWLGEAHKHLYLLRVLKKAVSCVCSLSELSSLPALFSDIKPYFDVFF